MSAGRYWAKHGTFPKLPESMVYRWKLMSGEGDVLGHKDKVRVVLATFECIL